MTTHSSTARRHGAVHPLWRAAVGLCLALAVLAPRWAQAASVPLDALFGHAEIGAVALSPTGRWLAATVPGKNRQRLELVVADLETNPLKLSTVAWLKDYDIARVAWLNDQRLVFIAFDSQAGEWAGETGLWAADVDGADNRMLIDPNMYGIRAVQTVTRQILPSEWVFYDTLHDGSADVLVLHTGWSSVRSRATYQLHRLSTHEPRPRRLDENAPEGTANWVLDRQGQPQWLEAVADGQRRVFRRGALAGWQQVATFDEFKPGGWSPRFLVGDQLLVSQEPQGAVGAQLFPWDEASGAPGTTPVLRASGFDVGDNALPLQEPAGQLLGWRYRLDAPYTRWADDTMAKHQAALNQAMPGWLNTIVCAPCTGAKRWLVVSQSDRRPVQYAVYTPASGRLLPLGSAHPEVPDAGLGARSFQRIRTRDGRDLPVYVTRPVAPSGSKAPASPVVVYVHGGPASRVTLEWAGDPVPQFLASRGYVVIEPEFRGSTGYGADHLRAGDGQWGLGMQDDLQDALRWAVAQGFADEKRACIMGASYGGYAALMGPIRHPDTYRCAIAWVAPTDLPHLLENVHDHMPMNRSMQATMARMMGANPAERSPLTHAARIKVPVLAAWGVQDQRVPIAQGRDFRDAARASKVELEYVEYADEGHVWMQPANRIDFFARAEKLLARALLAP